MNATTESFKPEAHMVDFVLLFLIGISALMLTSELFWAVDAVRNYVDIPVVSLPTLQQSARGISIYDRNDKYVCTLHAERDTQPVPLSAVSINMRKAVLAAEDRTFFTHHGVDFTAIARAFLANKREGHIKEGASTITQQLVRNLYLDRNDKSYRRKVREMCLAWNIEDRYSKKKILEVYLNEVYFGRGVNGVERAARAYFDKPASQLTIGESAFLAGLIKSPTTLSDLSNSKAAFRRQKEVLATMAKYGFITKSQQVASLPEQLQFKRGASALNFPYYVTYAMQMVRNELGDDMWRNSYRVYTNLDPVAQKNAEATLGRRIRSAPTGLNQAALVSESLKDGAVLAMVGGVGDYGSNQWNRAVHPHTAGSSFKPFVYLSGLMQGVLKPDSIIADEPVTIPIAGSKDYSPKNFDGRFMGWLTVRDALCHSRNICAVRVAQQASVERIIEVAHLAGIKSQIDPNLSVALGSCAVSPLDMATAYATLARGGVYMPPQMLRSIKTENGTTVKTFCATASTNLPVEQTRQLVDIMQDVVRRGTGTQARLAGIAVAGKTGTADKGRDIWFTGFTPDTATTVWAGNDSNHPVKGTNITGGAIMAAMWQQYMSSFYRSHHPSATTFTGPEIALIDKLPSASDTFELPATQTNLLASASPGIASIADVQHAMEIRKAQIAESQVIQLPTAAACTTASTPVGTELASGQQSL